MDFKNFFNFMLVEASKNLQESLTLNRECTPSIVASLTIHTGSVFLSQDWRVLSSTVLENNNDNMTQRLIMSPKDMMEDYIVVDIFLFHESSDWEQIIAYKEDNEILKLSSNHMIIGIAEGDNVISQELTCEDTLILPPSETASRRILWYIKEKN